MNRALVLAAVISLFALPAYGAPASAPHATDPLAPARAGKVLCFFPDAHKHCRSLSAYVFEPGGRILNPTLSLLSNKPVVIIKSLTAVTVRGGAVCGTLRPQELQRATVTVDGLAASKVQATNAKQLLLHAISGAGSPEVCATYVSNGTYVIVHATVGGVRQRTTQNAVWVSPDDHYIVAP